MLPLAATLPRAEIVGIDPSRRQVAEGQSIIQEIGVPNLRLVAIGVEDLGRELGDFDYIIAHGVYSWVSEAVRDQLMARISERLAPRGVAFVSYNVYPGWRFSSTIREMMLYHVEGMDEPGARIEAARSVIERLAAVHPDPNARHAEALREKAELLRGKSDAYVFHEYLEEFNKPVYFHEFDAHVRRHGLRVLADAQPTTWPVAQTASVREAISGLAGDDSVGREQYLDFLVDRAFRRSLVVHETARVNASKAAEALESLRLRVSCRPDSPSPDIHGETPEEYLATDFQTRFTTSSAVAKASLAVLGQVWPRSLFFLELKARVLDLLSTPPTGERVVSAAGPSGPLLLGCLLHGLIEAQTMEPPLEVGFNRLPLASAYARFEATRGPRVTNLLHRVVQLTEIDRLIVSRLDGRTDRDGIVQFLTELCRQGQFELTNRGRKIEDPTELGNLLESATESALVRLGRTGLLLGAVEDPSSGSTSHDKPS